MNKQFNIGNIDLWWGEVHDLDRDNSFSCWTLNQYTYIVGMIINKNIKSGPNHVYLVINKHDYLKKYTLLSICTAIFVDC